MTRDELLSRAESAVNTEGVPAYTDEFRGLMLHGILCVLLAREMRETEVAEHEAYRQDLRGDGGGCGDEREADADYGRAG